MARNDVAHVLLLFACARIGGAILVPGNPELGVAEARPWAQCRLVDDNGKDVGTDEVGELWVKHPIVMQGYFRDPEQTAATFHDERGRSCVIFDSAAPNVRRMAGSADRYQTHVWIFHRCPAVISGSRDDADVPSHFEAPTHGGLLRIVRPMDAEARSLLQSLVRETRTATLATLRGGAPNVSMVLVLPEDDFSAFHVRVSRLAWHTQDMQDDARVALSIQQNDAPARDPQQLARITPRGDAMQLPSDPDRPRFGGLTRPHSRGRLLVKRQSDEHRAPSDPDQSASGFSASLWSARP